MVVDEQFRKCVAFLCCEERSDTGTLDKVPRATAFFVALDAGNGMGFAYALTSRHVIDCSRPQGSLYIRMNKSGGGIQHFPLPQDSWTPSTASDVAAHRITFSTREFDYMCIPEDLIAMEDEAGNIHAPLYVGAEVIMIGLFQKYFGMTQAHPVCRFGKICSIPKEKVPVRMAPETAPVNIDAYLAESLSWGGESGSPVFAYTPNRRNSARTPLSFQAPKVIGLLHGHYEIEQKLKGEAASHGTVDLNSGIAVIVPSQEIIKVLNDPALLEEREKAMNEAKKRVAVPRPDFGEKVFTKADFEKALRKVSKHRSSRLAKGKS